MWIMTTLAAAVLASVPMREPWSAFVNDRAKHCDTVSGRSRFVGYPSGSDNGDFRANTNFWLKGVDFSCVSPWNSEGGRLRAGTAISKRHIIFAKHFPIAPGTRIVFVGEDGGVCPCHVEKTKVVEGAADVMVGLLNAELTSNIRPAKVLPPDFEKCVADGAKLPLVTIGQYEDAVLIELECRPVRPGSSMNLVNVDSEKEDWRKLGRDLVKGDSGSPAFVMVGGEPVLFYCLFLGGRGMGPYIHRYHAQIQKAMDELCPGYKLESFDFSKVGRVRHY